MTSVNGKKVILLLDRLDRYQIILLGDRSTWVLTTCPELLPDGAPAGSRTRDLWITSPTR